MVDDCNIVDDVTFRKTKTDYITIIDNIDNIGNNYDSIGEVDLIQTIVLLSPGILLGTGSGRTGLSSRPIMTLLYPQGESFRDPKINIRIFVTIFEETYTLHRFLFSHISNNYQENSISSNTQHWSDLDCSRERLQHRLQSAPT